MTKLSKPVIGVEVCESVFLGKLVREGGGVTYLAVTFLSKDVNTGSIAVQH